MINQEHPITPPPELVQGWYEDKTDYFIDMIRAAQWGADQELEACIAWFDTYIPGYELVADRLRAARRPKLLNLKEEALDVLHFSFDRGYLKKEDVDTIHRALELIND